MAHINFVLLPCDLSGGKECNSCSEHSQTISLQIVFDPIRDFCF